MSFFQFSQKPDTPVKNQRNQKMTVAGRGVKRRNFSNYAAVTVPSNLSPPPEERKTCGKIRPAHLTKNGIIVCLPTDLLYIGRCDHQGIHDSPTHVSAFPRPLSFHVMCDARGNQSANMGHRQSTELFSPFSAPPQGAVLVRRELAPRTIVNSLACFLQQQSCATVLLYFGSTARERCLSALLMAHAARARVLTAGCWWAGFLG